MRVITLKVDDELLEQVDLHAQMENTTRSEFIRRALVEYIIKLERRKLGEPRIIVIG